MTLRYTRERVLAEAMDGQVLLCQDTYMNEQVAVKCVQRRSSVERQIHQALCQDGGHCHILQLRDAYKHQDQQHLVMEYCPNGDLFDLIQKATHVSLDIVHRYFRQVAHGVAFMHRRGYAHRDLSLENVLLDDQLNCQICDFGLAVDASKLRKDVVGKPFYMAPEVVAGHMYSPAQADVWSLGVMLFMMLSGVPLCERASEKDARYRFIQAHGLRTLIHAWKISHRFDCAALDLLESMLHPNPKARPSMEQVLQHPYVGGSRQTPQTTQRKPMRRFLQRWFSRTVLNRTEVC